ncbi:hypothetical protein CDL15_Pgr026257 [Punica granatum]|uniref:Uncharacterized protein n=1 Tax=Punica granatum TaxID=22663 RepID=A0A218VSG9_PUNGR|nr:hypothetical protein CDL15_Pgr026257 [Punica granatum]
MYSNCSGLWGFTGRTQVAHGQSTKSMAVGRGSGELKEDEEQQQTTMTTTSGAQGSEGSGLAINCSK